MGEKKYWFGCGLVRGDNDGDVFADEAETLSDGTDDAFDDALPGRSRRAGGGGSGRTRAEGEGVCLPLAVTSNDGLSA